jgi:endoglucanase
VDENGTVTAHAYGTADITATSGDEQFSDTCTVEVVSRSAESVSLNKQEVTLKKGEEEKKSDLDSVFIDCGFKSAEEAKKFISIGDTIAFADEAVPLLGTKIASPYLDNKASVLALIFAFESVLSENDVYFVLSVGEETGYRGAKFAAQEIKPDFAFVVDVGFAYSPELDPTKCIEMGKGPSVSFSDTLSRSLTKWVINVADNQKIPLQMICEPGGTGTNATALQLQNDGIPSCVISIPLKNMHTSSEIVDEEDIIKTAKLLSTLASQDKFPVQKVILIERL